MPENTQEVISQKNSFVFTGNWSVFFNIWIINMLLSVITLGIYSPWAKVRNNQYLYSSTELNGSPFEYTANPVRILIGRFIVVGSYIFYLVLADMLGLHTFALIFIGAFMCCIPFLIRQAICFKMRYTKYRGLSFYHFGSLWQYYKFFIVHLFLLIVTVGIIFPYTYKKFKQLVINNTSYGSEEFNFEASVGKFYIAYLKTIGLTLAPVIMFGILLSSYVAVVFDLIDINATKEMPVETIMMFGSIILFGYIFFIILGPFVKGVLAGWLGNILYNSTTLGEFSFQSDWNPWHIGWIILSNTVVLLLTFGLMYPWAKIRMLTYKLKHTYLVGEGFNSFVKTSQQEPNALGEEAVDFFDIDVGL